MLIIVETAETRLKVANRVNARVAAGAKILLKRKSARTVLSVQTTSSVIT